MSLGNILGQILQQGMASQSRSRLEHTVGAGGLGDLLGGMLGGGAGGSGAAGRGLGDLLGSATGGGGARSGQGAGGLGDLLGGLLGGQAGGRAAGGGGLGDLLGSVLGGGTGGRSGSNSLGGNGMALLATVAMAALKNWTASRGGAVGLTADVSGIPHEDVAALTAPETEALVLRAMISASKADGEVDEAEVQRVVGRIDDDGVTPQEKQFIVDELRRPLDLQALVSAVPNEAVAAQIYGASLLAIDLDTAAEIAYLRQLAQGLGLDAGTVARLHQITGAPAI